MTTEALELEELILSYQHASYRYHAIAKQLNPSKHDLVEWLEGLDPEVRPCIKRLSFNECLEMVSFTRYINEKNDIGMDDYLKKVMGAKNYQAYKKLMDDYQSSSDT